MSYSTVFPFTAVMGQEKVKKALILNIINPYIGGVLISGEKGTAKSTLVRGAAQIADSMEVVNLPLNITEDRLIGTIHMEEAISKGRKEIDFGLLKKAHGNILYVDEVNLLSEHIVNSLLEVCASGVNRVEREGISHRHSSRFILVGTMNPEEGLLRPQFLDRFGLYVEAKGSRDLEDRKSIIKRRLEFEKSPVEFINYWEAENIKLSEKIKSARNMFSKVRITEDNMKMASQLSMESSCAGHRAEIAVIETARAIASFNQRENIILQDIKEAAEFALPHRMREPISPYEGQQEPDESKNSQNDKQFNGDMSNSQYDKDESSEQNGSSHSQKTDMSLFNEDIQDNNKENKNKSEKNKTDNSVQDKVDEPGEMPDIKFLTLKADDNVVKKGSGKRAKVKTCSGQGRYIKYKMPKGRIRDLAFDATFRAALPFQKLRHNQKVKVIIQKSDFREKVREKRTGASILFVVDASGSMGVNKRMKAVKGAVLSLLNEAYQKRDRVGMLAFRKDEAKLLLGITRSVDLAEKYLRELSTGGRTPLSEGLYSGYEIIKAVMAKDRDTIPLMVLISDGRSNVSIDGNKKPFDEACKIAERISKEGIQTLVIDCETGFIRLGLAEKLAEVMKAEYIKLDELNAVEIKKAIKNLV